MTVEDVMRGSDERDIPKPIAHINSIYVDGAFVTHHGRELFDLHNPATSGIIGRVRLVTCH